MRERELRRRCRQLLNSLDIRPPLDVRLLCARLGERRGKPIQLVEHPIPVPGPFGARITTPTTDYILYQQETSKAHLDHIVLHEVGHLIAGHRNDEEDDELLSTLCPNVSPEAVRRALRRTSYDTEHEREAESVATIILEWASVLDRVAPRLLDDGTPENRYDEALIDRMDWL